MIVKNVTWEESCYVVIEPIVVTLGATLKIKPGVTIYFRKGLGLTIGDDDVGPGTLLAMGKKDRKIKFTSYAPCEDPPVDPARGDWARIYLTDKATDAEYDENGNYVSGTILEHVIVEYSGSAGAAISGDKCSPYLAHCEVKDNAKLGIWVGASDGADVKIENCVVHDNGGGGIYVNTTEGGAVSIQYCQIHDHKNGRGINVTPGSSPARIEYCEIARCTIPNWHGGGIYVWGGADHIVRSNVIEDCVATTNDFHYGGGMFINAARTTLESNTVSGCRARVGGGIVLWNNSDGSTLSRNEVTGNTATHWREPWTWVGGGGIYLWQSSSTLVGNTVTRNTATHPGGGICLHESGSCTLKENTISRNSATGAEGRGLGGGIYLVDSGNCTLTQNAVTGNRTLGSESYGGGIHLHRSGNSKLDSNTVTENETTGANASGGGIYLEFSGGTILKSNTVTGNATTGADATGGGIYLVYSGDTNLTSNTVTQNRAGANGNGGGIRVGGGSCWLTGNTITSNTCGGVGGGIVFYDCNPAVLTSNVITDNTAGNAGAIRFSTIKNCTMTDSIILRNHATNGDVGGIFVQYSPSVSFKGDPDTGTYNTICCNDGYDVYNDNTFDPEDGCRSADIDARYVRWCTDDSQNIADRIYDYFDDDVKGFVYALPFAPPGGCSGHEKLGKPKCRKNKIKVSLSGAIPEATITFRLDSDEKTDKKRTIGCDGKAKVKFKASPGPHTVEVLECYVPPRDVDCP